MSEDPFTKLFGQAQEPHVETISADRLLRKVRERMFDFAAFERRSYEATVGQPATCHQGCAYCCYSKILIDAAMGAFIYLFLRFAGRWTEALEKRLQDADRAMAPVSHEAWITRQVPCVFLKPQGQGRGTCTVYPVRPLGCLMTFARVADPAECAVPGGHAQEHIVPDDDGQTMRQLMAYHEGLLNGLGETRHWTMTIPAAVLYGRALVEKLPLPFVARVDKEQAVALEVSIDVLFDKTAADWARRGILL